MLLQVVNNLRVNIRLKTEELRAKLKTILSREYKKLAVQELKLVGNGVQNIVFRGDSEKGPLAFRVPRIAETNEIDWYEFENGYKNEDIFESIPRIVSLFYQLDTAVMLANLFIAQLKIEDKGIFYKECVKTLHNEIHRYL
ncbi:TPA: hypothetical protein ROX88_003372 [Bacillus pseudomycoides]|nr:hypothetical protein [Bacillus pseudomycoides]